jgi:hypothetical protein
LAVTAGPAALAVDNEPDVVVVPAEPVVPVAPDGAVVQTERVVVVRHIGDVSKLPSGGLSAVEQAIPGGTITDVDKVAMKDAWDVEVVDRQGRIHDVRVDKAGRVVIDKENRRQSLRVANLPESVKRAVKQRYPDAVMYNTEVTVEDGEKAHEVEIISQGRLVDVKVTPDGRILEVETDEDDVGHDPKPQQ